MALKNNDGGSITRNVFFSLNSACISQPPPPRPVLQMRQSLRRRMITLLQDPTVMSPTGYHPSLKLVHGRPNMRLVLHDEISCMH